MVNRLPHEPPPPSIATLRFIVTSLIFGACVVGGTVLFSATRIGGKMIADPLISYLFAGVAAVAIVVQAFLPQLFRARKATAANETERLKLYGTEVLARVGLIEAAALMQYICYLLTINDLTLAAGILLVLAMLVLRPNEESFRSWCED